MRRPGSVTLPFREAPPLSPQSVVRAVSSPPALRRDWVVKSNDLINARYDWTALQQRMVLLMIGQLDMEADDFGNQRIDVAEIVERAGLRGNGYYERVAEAASVLLDQKIFVRTETGAWRGYNLLSFVEPHPGHIVARFNPDMRPFLLQLRRRFTRYMLEHVLRFQSPYSVRIYEMAMQFADLGHRTLLIDDLRETLGVAEKYPRFYDFKRRVLDQAVREIARYTDVVVSYDILRNGRVPEKIKLFIRPKAHADLPAKSTTSRDAAQKSLDFVLPEATPAPDPESVAFRAWWDGRSEAERATIEAEAVERLDPFVRKFQRDSPNSLAVQSSLAVEIRAIWHERTAVPAGGLS